MYHNDFVSHYNKKEQRPPPLASTLTINRKKVSSYITCTLVIECLFGE